ncbi:MAG: nitrate reductase cytochrome c-type subunit [Gemmataceae bacterium]|nr:nitrate reductase cytochrome c-type subunit [Gemmataceae bacterium]
MSETPPPDHPHTAADLLPHRLQRFATLLAAVAVGTALFGLLTGLREPPRPERPAPPSHADHRSVPAAVGYADLPTANLRPDAGRNRTLAGLRYDQPGAFDPVVRTEEMKRAALADRAKNRAYDGAPPTIPHPVDSQSTASCLACHGEGLKVGDRVASRMSHPLMTNCTQCHVEQSPVPAETTFVGVYRAGPGGRASPGAPPTVPHHTWMRENCASCHGLVTRPGTRTTHPWLTNCTQCHAPSAALDQTEFAEGQK